MNNLLTKCVTILLLSSSPAVDGVIGEQLTRLGVRLARN
jgi:hypothetical protein